MIASDQKIKRRYIRLLCSLLICFKIPKMPWPNSEQRKEVNVHKFHINHKHGHEIVNKKKTRSRSIHSSDMLSARLDCWHYTLPNDRIVHFISCKDQRSTRIQVVSCGNFDLSNTNSTEIVHLLLACRRKCVQKTNTRCDYCI